jgi:hypothetical protein
MDLNFCLVLFGIAEISVVIADKLAGLFPYALILAQAQSAQAFVGLLQ